MDEQHDHAAPDDEPAQRVEEQPGERSADADALLKELVAYLREHHTELREEWARRISEAHSFR